MRDRAVGSRSGPRASSEAGFTLIEVSVAAILVVLFSLAFASSFSAAFGASRGNMLRQQATAIVNEELEYARALSWPETAMTYVYTSAPMLNFSSDSLDGTEVGFAGYEVLAVLPSTGAVAPLRTYSVDGTGYTVWRYVTHSASGMRRVVVLAEWSDEGASETLLGATLVSEVSARANAGGVTTTTTLAPPTTTTTVAPTTTTTTVAPTTTTTTTLPLDPPLFLSQLTLSLGDNEDIPEAQAFVQDEFANNMNGATVYGEWSTSPVEPGYPFAVTMNTSGPGRAIFQNADDHAVGTIVQFCVTDIVLAGYSYSGGTQCVSEVWT